MIKNESAFGFQKQDEDSSYESMKERVQDEIEKVFRPEFLNRVDDTIVFRHLTEEDLKDVIELEVAKVRQRLSERGLALVLTDQSKEFIIKKACKKLEFGARPLRRAIENMIEDPLSEELLKGEFEGQDTITVDVKKVADKKQLFFEGSVTHEPEEAQPVGAAAGGPSGEEPPGGD
jgi:ATP-dependent Clp protease ATP-binding subunit ClpC